MRRTSKIHGNTLYFNLNTWLFKKNGTKKKKKNWWGKFIVYVI